MFDTSIRGEYRLAQRATRAGIPPTGAGFSIDDIVAGLAVPVPTQIKIDVDGIEHRVILGARLTLVDN